MYYQHIIRNMFQGRVLQLKCGSYKMQSNMQFYNDVSTFLPTVEDIDFLWRACCTKFT